MSKLSNALDLLGYYIDDYEYMGNGEDQEILAKAQQELLEFQRIQSTIKEFIDDYDLKKASDIKGLDHDETYDFIRELCDIVGYSE